MMTTVQALVWSGILTLLMVLVASAFCARVWEPGGVMVAFGNREGVAPPMGMAGRADRAARNMLEAMVMFLAVVLAAQIAGKGAQAAMGATVLQSKTLAVIPDEEQVLSEDLQPDRSAAKLARQHRWIPIVAKSQRGLVVTRPGTRSRPALAVLIDCVKDVRFHDKNYSKVDPLTRSHGSLHNFKPLSCTGVDGCIHQTLGQLFHARDVAGFHGKSAALIFVHAGATRHTEPSGRYAARS